MPRKGKSKKTSAHPKPAKRVSTAAAAVRDVGAAQLKLVRVIGQGTEFSRVADGAPVVVHSKGTRVLSDPLDYYLHRQTIDGDQYSAGNALRINHFRAFGSGFHGVNLSGFHGVSNYADNWRINPTRGEAMHELRQTLELFAPSHSRMLVAVCCHGIYAKHAAKSSGVHWRRGIKLLREALTMLAEYYRTGKRPILPKAPTVGEGFGG